MTPVMIDSNCSQATNQPFSGRKPVFALLVRLFWAAVVVLPVVGARAAVVFSSLHSFNGTNEVANPQAGLVQGSDGNFCGTTVYGGLNEVGDGSLFTITSNGALSPLHLLVNLNFGDGLNNAHPDAVIICHYAGEISPFLLGANPSAN